MSVRLRVSEAGVVALPGHAAPGAAALRDPYAYATLALAHGAVLLVGFDYRIGFGASATLPVAIALLPLWIRATREYGLARLMLWTSLACVVSGLVLATIAAQDHDISSSSRSQVIGLLLTGMAALAIILWARQLIPLHRVVALYGAGGVAEAVLDGRLTWKYGVAIPATFLVLGVVERRGSRVRAATTIILLGLVGASDDYRSYFAFCLLAATLTLWQARPAAVDAARRSWWPAVLLAGIAASMYLLTSALLTAGYLGEEVQARTTQQIEQSGSLLAGGRPEWAATIELVKVRPIGYGAGVVPNREDVQTAKAGLDSVNVGLNPERDRYMFGGEFRLHSIIADLWIRFGLPGLLLAGTILVAVVRSLSFSLAERRAATSVILASLLALWSLAFEPSYTYWVRVCVALGFVLVARAAPSRSLTGGGYDAQLNGL